MKAIHLDPPPHIHVSCDEANMLAWNYLLEGPADTPYEGGWYWGKLKFPKEYPHRPPSILMLTPSGRFETNTRLCLSMTDFHPESWNPFWCLSTVLKGLLSFMCEESDTAGAIRPPAPNEERRRLALASLGWNKAQADFMKAFPEVDSIVAGAAGGSAQSSSSAKGLESEPRDLTPPGPDSAAETAAFVPGDIVRVRALKVRPDLNGQDAEVVATTNAEIIADGRVPIRVAGMTIAVKPDKLELVRRQGAGEASG